MTAPRSSHPERVGERGRGTRGKHRGQGVRGGSRREATSVTPPRQSGCGCRATPAAYAGFSRARFPTPAPYHPLCLWPLPVAPVRMGGVQLWSAARMSAAGGAPTRRANGSGSPCGRGRPAAPTAGWARRQNEAGGEEAERVTEPDLSAEGVDSVALVSGGEEGGGGRESEAACRRRRPSTTCPGDGGRQSVNLLALRDPAGVKRRVGGHRGAAAAAAADAAEVSISARLPPPASTLTTVRPVIGCQWAALAAAAGVPVHRPPRRRSRNPRGGVAAPQALPRVAAFQTGTSMSLLFDTSCSLS